MGEQEGEGEGCVEPVDVKLGVEGGGSACIVAGCIGARSGMAFWFRSLTSSSLVTSL